jgi:hypothetical protein
MDRPRTIKMEAHVLAYIGDYLSAFKAVIKRKTELTLAEMPRSNSQTPQPQVRYPAGRS